LIVEQAETHLRVLVPIEEEEDYYYDDDDMIINIDSFKDQTLSNNIRQQAGLYLPVRAIK
jgi:uncharacterized protein YneR